MKDSGNASGIGTPHLGGRNTSWRDDHGLHDLFLLEQHPISRDGPSSRTTEPPSVRYRLNRVPRDR